MDLSGTQGELAIPMHATVVSPYGGGGAAAAGHVLKLHHHEQQHGSNNNNNNGQSPAVAALPPSPPPAAAAPEDMETSAKKRGGPAAAAARYRECLKNHAAAIGGSATDGCGEFMPSGEEGSLEALKCSACGCHRNFHRKEVDDGGDGDAGDDVIYAAAGHGHRAARRLLAPALPHPHRGNIGGGLLVSAAAGDPYGAYAAAARALPPPPGHGHGHGHGHPHQHHHHQYVMPLSMVHNSESDEMDGAAAAAVGGGGSSSSARKRFRTKFTAEQKARMLEFAERVGWRLQKLDEAMVNGFCQEIGVKRRVLKVWMHNNKHNLATTRRLDASPPAPALQMMPPAGVMPPPPGMLQPGSPPALKLE